MIKDQTEENEYQEGQQVEIIVKMKTPLGYKVIVDGKYWGVIYHNEVFQDIGKDEKLIGFVKKLRADRKLDISLYETGNKEADAIGAQIIHRLQNAGGFLPINSQTSPDEIYEMFGVSKKKFKIALGGLYKQRVIEVTEEGIRLRRNLDE